jgi:hypothetical protein
MAEEQVNRFWLQALKEPDKKMVLSIVLSAVTNALKERPERYNIIFNDNTSSNNEKQDAVLEVANVLANSVIERSVNHVMSTLESQAETEVESEANNAEAKHPIDQSTETDVAETKADNTVVAEATAAAVQDEEKQANLAEESKAQDVNDDVTFASSASSTTSAEETDR